MKRRSLADPNLVEKYIRGQVLPRFMQRLREIEDELARHRSRLADAYEELWVSCGHDSQTFEQRWRATAHSWRFDHVNELIHSHNEHYPIERRLPINPRTGDYLTTSGRPWRREPAGPKWILERFPARRGPI
jgi:glucose-6-phosphate 1-dehydrogenase